MLSIAVQNHRILKSRRARRRQTFPQRCSLSKIHFMPNHLRARLLRLPSRVIQTAVIDYPDRLHFLQSCHYNTPYRPGLVKAWNHCGAQKITIHSTTLVASPVLNEVYFPLTLRAESPLNSRVTSNNPGPNLTELLARNGEQTALHERAAAAARTHFGDTVFVRAVVELSNFCRENCHYCGMRRANRELNRYRAKFEELAELLLHHLPSSVTDVNFQAGEDPIAARELAIPLIQLLRRETDLGVSVCLGTLDHSLYNELREAGASIYILKFETSNASNYDAFEAPGKFNERLDHIRHLAATGWNVSSGFICGLPNEKPEDWLASLQLANSLPLAGCSVSPFVPGEATPLANAETGEIDLVLNCMAAMRLMRPDWVIPAVSALNICQPELGYRRGLRTGANLVTMNLTPAGLRENYVLYKRDRFIMDEERILRALDAEGLKPSKIGLAKFYETRRLTRAVPVPTAAI